MCDFQERESGIDRIHPLQIPLGARLLARCVLRKGPNAKVKEKRLSQVSPAKRKPFGELKSNARPPVAKVRQGENREQQGVEIVYLGTRGRG